jgi:predicted aspartyl protease
MLPAGVVNHFRVSSVKGETSDAHAFAPPESAERTRFDSSVPSEVPVWRGGPGFLLVEPEIDGVKIGRFIFDTGAGANVITPQAAERLGLAAIGSSWLGLAAGANAGTVRPAGAMRLGPLTIEQPAFVEMDLTALVTATGLEIAGIVGYDVLRRAIVEIEAAAPGLAIKDPRTPPERGDAWQPIVIYRNHVYVRARVEQHEGWFRIDTGAPQVPLIFHAPAVSELSLLDGRETTRATIGVPGGTMEVAMGEVKGFELAGYRFASLPAIFPSEAKGAFADPETIGNAGLECLGPFRVTFDYGRRRAAFVKRD